MRLVAPLGGVYQAGTLSGNPIATAAGLATLQILQKTNPYPALEKKTVYLTQGILNAAKQYSLPIQINQMGTMFTVFFTEEKVTDYRTAAKQNSKQFSIFFHSLLDQGIYFSPSGYEANFMGIAHTQKDLDKTLSAVSKAFQKVKRMTYGKASR